MGCMSRTRLGPGRGLHMPTLRRFRAQGTCSSVVLLCRLRQSQWESASGRLQRTSGPGTGEAD
eukprot:319945-Alexandrium_andersonii.AAC.1